ncbi:helix-loop-helix DNA-binding domain-containing protein [Colletotrichum zoysiae]|uniref:Helix-loop-helix DNA-binding domain-containing protein n=1 Tax=Colletotrichum zoysiae TaxID=1216348 RepID=A0AAD9H559_9PEZI|nr:helix-loop-helix DNA-binding domain-containing protein [Colletotrichum zoysiae]
MPRPTLPPTPASSTDIKGQDGSKNLNSLQLSFELPPPAITQDASRISPKDTQASPITEFRSILPSKTAPYPVQPSETVKSRRRSSAAQRAASNQSFALPPPPTRSRKIIQMKPRAVQEEPEKAPETTGANSGASAPGKTAAAAGTATTAQGKKKQSSTTSAAGRKTARKTAHSLIERRRRSKMNEEFAVLKGMIPACTGEMHKLAILQASIEYVRYLEDCVAKLKAQQDASEARSPPESGLQTPAGRGESWGSIPQFVPGHQEDSDDVDMTESEALSPARPSVSPALLPQDASSRHRHDSYSSVSTDHQRQYNYSTSSTTSPAFGPQTYVGYGHGGGLGSALTSPALAPQRDPDQEATVALLMLNSDRRGTIGDASTVAGAGAMRSAGRGMSVRDLLST